jgi:hypothetical protein
LTKRRHQSKWRSFCERGTIGGAGIAGKGNVNDATTEEVIKTMAGMQANRSWFAMSIKDILWLSLVLLAGFGWYGHSFVMCPECPETAVRYAQIRAENETHARDWETSCERIQKAIEERKQELTDTLVGTVHVRAEIRRLEQLERQLTEWRAQED